MTEQRVEVGQVWERNSGPRLMAEVERLDGGQAMCRLRRGSGVPFPGLRPVPHSLLLSRAFTLVTQPTGAGLGEGGTTR